MKQKHSQLVAASLALYMVSSLAPFESATAYATTSGGTRAAASGKPDKGSFAIAINDSLPGEEKAAAAQANTEAHATEAEGQHEVASEIDVADAQEQTPQPKKGGFFSAWSLPISGPLVFARHKKQEKQTQDKLVGSIDYEDPYDGITSYVDGLLDCALSRDPNSSELDKAVTKYRKRSQIIIAESKDACNYVIPYRGFGPSKEAGDLITGEKVKVKSRAAAEFARQKLVDEIHMKVTSNMMQIAMGLGMADQERGQTVTASGVAALSELVGSEEAEKTKAMLQKMTSQISMNDEVFQKPEWDVQERQKIHRTVLELSLEDDPVIHQIKKHLHKYNHRSKFAMVSSSVVQTVLGAASLTPTFVGPAAKAALVAFVMATGGPEQCKLLKELYLDKRLESRSKVLNEEAHLAIDNYQLAILTKNPVLLGYSEMVVGQMVGGHHINEVFGKSLLAGNPEAAHSTAM